MENSESSLDYSPLEEKFNIYTHGFGFVMSLVATVLFCFRASISEKPASTTIFLVSALIFSLSLCVLYFASTAYHSATIPKRRARLKIFDHAAIYVLIAGTYTPFTLITLEGTTGWILFAVAWTFAAIGVGLKLFFTGRFKILSTVLYVLMGWLIVFAYSPLLEHLHPKGVEWLFGGGIAYTLGAVLYAIKKIPFNHAIFHVFVLLGSFCHFMAVFYYV